MALGQIRYRPIFSSYLRPYLLIWRASVRLEFSWAETTAGSMDHDERGGMPTAAKRPRESSFFPGAEFSKGGCCGVYVDGQTTTVCRVLRPAFRSQSGKNSEQCTLCYGPSLRLAALTAAKQNKRVVIRLQSSRSRAQIMASPLWFHWGRAQRAARWFNLLRLESRRARWCRCA